MSNSESVFRQLARSYASSLITRQQYVQIRSLLLKKLESKGTVEDEDLENFSKLAESSDVPRTEESYTSSDWIIIALGIAASAVLGFIQYS